MDVDIEIVSTAACIFPDQAFFVRFLNRSLEHGGLVIKLSANVDVGCVRVHGTAGHETAFDEFVGIFAHDFAVFAGPGFAFVGIDDEIAGFGVFIPVFEVHK